MIPKKIRPYFIEKLNNLCDDTVFVEGELSCCESHNFEICVEGKIKKTMFFRMGLFPVNDNMVLTVCCKKCKKVLSVFDSKVDGYEPHNINPNMHIATQSVICKKCNHNDFSLDVKYEYSNIYELKEKNNDNENAFTWLWVSLKCNHCGAKYKNFIDFETT